MKDFIITNVVFDEAEFTAAAYYVDNKMALLDIRGAGEKSRIGHIYQCKCEKSQSNINALYLNAGDFRCYLSGSSHKTGDEFPVVVKKDAHGGKLASVSENLEISGRYSVVEEGQTGVVFSSKLTRVQKNNISPWFSEIEHEGLKIVVRTNAAYCEKRIVLDELKKNIDTIRSIRKQSEHAVCRSCLYRPKPFYINLLSGIYKEMPERIRTDSVAVYRELTACGEAENIELYNDVNYPLSSMYNLRRDLGRLMDKKVYLKSGAYLVIEKTEAFVSIDVNSGKNIKGKKSEETFRKVNLEAGEEILRQLSLRNLSGMILVDFISLSDPEHSRELLNVMRKKASREYARTKVIDITPLGIMEITRSKESLSLEERVASEKERNNLC